MLKAACEALNIKEPANLEAATAASRDRKER
jgi:hypothetical protein